MLLRCEWSKLQTLLRSRAKQKGRTSKNGSVTQKNDSKCKPTISPPYRDKSEKILFRKLLQTFPWQTSEHYPSARQRHNYNTLKPLTCCIVITPGCRTGSKAEEHRVRARPHLRGLYYPGSCAEPNAARLRLLSSPCDARP